MNKHPFKLDANESAFFENELKYVKSKAYDTKQKPLKGLTLIPISTEAGVGVRDITFQRYTGIGFAKVISDYAKDLPRADVYGEEVTVKVRSIGASYGYTIDEIRASQVSGKRLDQRKAAAARRAIEQKLNALALRGDANSKIQGLLNYPGISDYTVPADGTSSSKNWSKKTADQIVRDISGLTTLVMSSTNGVEAPTDLILPLDQYNLIATTRVGSNSDKTILAYVLETHPSLKRIDWLVELKGAGSSGTDRMMCFVKDEDHMTFELPLPFEQFDAQQEGLEFSVPCMAKTAGVIVYYPLSIAYGDGI